LEKGNDLEKMIAFGKEECFWKRNASGKEKCCE
jgi:hypothetical protein